MNTYATPTAIEAVLDIPAARVRVVAAERTDTVVDIRPADAGSRRDVQAAGRVEVGYAAGVLRVEAARPVSRLLGSSGQVEVTVHLPAGSRIEARTGAGDFRGVGRLGDVAVDLAQGGITLDETAAAHLTLQDGDVTVGRLGGPARISTQKGDLSVTEAVSGTVTLTTSYGDITVGAARTADASLDAGTTSGRIRNALTSSGTGTALTIHATTTRGDITARSL